ncbi:hypothetical protein V6N13_116569 [Hibiscus sabdariffa]
MRRTSKSVRSLNSLLPTKAAEEPKNRITSGIGTEFWSGSAKRVFSSTTVESVRQRQRQTKLVTVCISTGI